MKTKLLFLTLAILSLLSIADLRAGELTMHWNLWNAGKIPITDMQFMPDNDYFVLATTEDLQIRSTETGEIVKTYPIIANQIEFTPDSTKMILIRYDVLEIRNIEDFSLINSYKLPPDENGLSVGFVEFKVDPIRPNLYAIAKKSGDIGGGKQVIIRRILAFNYETMKVVEDLTPPNYETELCEKLAVSIDGKYLVAVNGWNSYIKVFDLSTNNVIKSLMLSNVWKPESGRDAGHASCVKFSEIDTDKIYISGVFPKDEDDGSLSGLIIYSINKNKIVDSTFAMKNNAVTAGYFILFDDDERTVYTNGFQMYVINLKNHIKEVSGGIYYINKQILYSSAKNIIIGRGEVHITKLTYDSSSSINIDETPKDTIYPNPTKDSIFLNYDCDNIDYSWELFNLKGELLTSSQKNIQLENSNQRKISLNDYPTGIYILQVTCGDKVEVFKVVKEG